MIVENERFEVRKNSFSMYTGGLRDKEKRLGEIRSKKCKADMLLN